MTGVTVGSAIDIDGKGLSITIGPGTLVAGDYWIIPARAITGKVLWPESAPNVPAQLRPFGTAQSCALLGLLERTGSNWTLLSAVSYTHLTLPTIYSV